MAAPSARRRKRAKRHRLSWRPRGHSQRPPECCGTHAAAAALEGSACWDCVTLELADTRLGLATLLGYAANGPAYGVAVPAMSVLDALISAEEAIRARGRDW